MHPVPNSTRHPRRRSLSKKAQFGNLSWRIPKLLFVSLGVATETRA